MQPGPIHIHQVIVHKVDKKVLNVLDLSDLPSPLDDQKVIEFLCRRIAENREHIHSRRARFLARDGQSVGFEGWSDALLNDPVQFVPGSRQIATHLFDCMDKRTSPGDLLLATYSDGSADAPLCLALLKMDPEDGLQREKEIVAGQARTLLKPVADLLPTGELQKCAFILHPSLRSSAGYDLIVLDQQIARYRTRRMVSSFFSNSFLQCRLAHEPDYLTDHFYYDSYDWIDNQRHWSPLDRQLAWERIEDALNLREVNAPAVAREITQDAGEQQAYLDHLRSKELDLSFAPDPARRERIFKYRVFEGDHELRVKILSDAVGPGRTLHAVENPETGWWTVTITTHRWEPQPK
jgi:hypothetical protein